MRKPRNRKPRNPDRVMAQHVDPVFSFETDACASLDDEIENWERLQPGMPFGGEDQPIRGFQSWMDD